MFQFIFNSGNARPLMVVGAAVLGILNGQWINSVMKRKKIEYENNGNNENSHTTTTDNSEVLFDKNINNN